LSLLATGVICGMAFKFTWLGSVALGVIYGWCGLCLAIERSRTPKLRRWLFPVTAVVAFVIIPSAIGAEFYVKSLMLFLTVAVVVSAIGVCVHFVGPIVSKQRGPDKPG
jgi:uncharacterized membrane protein